MDAPLVTVVCLCHNHAPYVQMAMDSVLGQEYPRVELIVVDDGSTDGSKELIRQFLSLHPEVPYVDNALPVGNCRAFNQGWQLAKGAYVIDLAADDVLLSGRIAEGVKRLEETGAGVHYCDAELIDAQGMHLGLHSGRVADAFPEGDIYAELVRRFVIAAPTMMVRREVMEYLGGYDESLSYEDFDFWVRSSRAFTYCCTPSPLVQKRQLKHSHGQAQRRWRNAHQRSTLAVCKKIAALNRTAYERKAFRERCWHEIRQCIKKGNLALIPDYLFLLKNNAS